MTLAILGIGTAVPGTSVSQPEALNIARSLCCRTKEHETWLPTMYEGTGIRSRHFCFGADLVRDVLNGTKHSGSIFLPTGAADDRGPTTAERMHFYAESAPPLALAAANNALAASGLQAAELTHLITVSCTGFLAPGLDVALIRGLGLAPTVQRTHVGYMGCHGAINGLRVARAFADSDPGARVLVCAVELCSLHYHYGWDPQRMIANAIFGDGGRAGGICRVWQHVVADGVVHPRSPAARGRAAALRRARLRAGSDGRRIVAALIRICRFWLR